MSEDKIQPWKIEQNLHHGFVYVVDHDGKKVCTVYGSDDIKMQRAMAIAEIPLMLSKTDTIAKTLDRAINALRSAKNRLETIKECSPEYAIDDDIRIYEQALTELKKLRGEG